MEGDGVADDCRRIGEDAADRGIGVALGGGIQAKALEGVGEGGCRETSEGVELVLCELGHRVWVAILPEFGPCCQIVKCGAFDCHGMERGIPFSL